MQPGKRSTGESSTPRRARFGNVSPLIAAAVGLYVADMELDVAGASAIEIF
jgi:hypothetical protein